MKAPIILRKRRVPGAIDPIVCPLVELSFEGMGIGVVQMDDDGDILTNDATISKSIILTIARLLYALSWCPALDILDTDPFPQDRFASPFLHWRLEERSCITVAGRRVKSTYVALATQ